MINIGNFEAAFRHAVEPCDPSGADTTRGADVSRGADVDSVLQRLGNHWDDVPAYCNDVFPTNAFNLVCSARHIAKRARAALNSNVDSCLYSGGTSIVGHECTLRHGSGISFFRLNQFRRLPRLDIATLASKRHRPRRLASRFTTRTLR